MPTALVTGANRGIGLELVRQLLDGTSSLGAHSVLAACREPSNALGQTSAEVLKGIDVITDEGVDWLKKAVDGRPLDVLVCNAGILRRETLDHLDLDGIRAQLEVNALGPLRTVHAMLGSLGAGAKIGLVTSRMGSIADNDSGSSYGYRMSKAALNAAGKSLSVDLKPRKVAVAVLHPGFVKTDMTGGSGNLTPRESAAALLDRLAELNIENTGTFWHAQGEVLPW